MMLHLNIRSDLAADFFLHPFHDQGVPRHGKDKALHQSAKRKEKNNESITD